jgi:hypothetical protein
MITVCPRRTHRATTPPSLAPAVVEEWRRLTVVPRLSVRQGPRAFPLTLCSTALIMVMWLAEMTRQGAVAVRFLGGVSAKLPLDVALLRLPGSAMTPAPNLPAWGALAQVLLVFGLAEAWFGVRRTLGIALMATALSTLGGRIMCMLGPHHVLGLPSAEAGVLDTGPSAAVVALMVCVCFRRRAWLTLSALVTTMVGELIMQPDLAGREHIIAIAVGVVAASPLIPARAPGLADLGERGGAGQPVRRDAVHAHRLVPVVGDRDLPLRPVELGASCSGDLHPGWAHPCALNVTDPCGAGVLARANRVEARDHWTVSGWLVKGLR